MFSIDDQIMPLDPAYSVIDHEFHYLHHQITFLNGVTDRVVVRGIDPRSGDWAGPPQEFDPDYPVVLGYPGNGPEWAISQRGSELYWTRERDGAVEIVRGNQDSEIEPLPNTSGCAPMDPSKSPAFEVPIVMFRRGPKAYWREDRLGVAHPIDHEIPGATHFGHLSGSPVRPIHNERAILMAYGEEATGIKLVWRDLTRNGEPVSELLLRQYPAGSQIIGVGAIRAPHRDSPQGKAHVLYAMVDYRRIDSFLVRVAGGVPTLEGYYKLKPPGTGDYQYLLDNESFISRYHEPYVVVTLGTTRSDFPDDTEVWVMSAFPASAPLYRKITHNRRGGRALKDPEPLKLEGGIYIYYREKVPGSGGRYGLWRAATGL